MQAVSQHVEISALLDTIWAPKLGLATVQSHVEQHYRLRGNWKALGGEREQNFQLTTADGDYVVKIASQAESLESLEFQSEALRHLQCVGVSLRVPQIIASDGQGHITFIQDGGGRSFPLRVLTYVTGQTVYEALASRAIPCSMADLSSIGDAHGRLAFALRGYMHRGAFRTMPWDITQGLIGHQSLFATLPEALQKHWLTISSRLLAETLPKLKRLRSQIIHHDFHESNLLVSPNGDQNDFGVIDFGDMIYGTVPQDLAVSIASFIHWNADPVLAAQAIARGYQRHVPMERAEMEVLYDLVLGRMLLQIAMTSYQRSTLGRHDATLEELSEVYADTIIRLSQVTPEQFVACMEPLIPSLPNKASGEADPQDILRRRNEVLGQTYMFYDKPVHLVRGAGSSVFDIDGKRYLDCYNNVPNVGHSHPHVVAAIAAQAAMLNTNTRYLHGEIVRLAERLSKTMPPELDTWVFTCSGSEANDLAVRIARTVTGRQGVLVTENSYHGNTTVTTDLSLIEYDKDARPAWVGLLPPPNVYRGLYQTGEADIGEKYARHVDFARADMIASGQDVAAMLVDSIFDANGALVPPPDYLSDAYRRTRSAGGLCIADEVQMGFGRSGTHMWGFEAFGVVPDIVTMGKPMGNGHPIAAVVMRREIASEFREHIGYFNTFGGNTVSCAAANATLDVLIHDRLMDRAKVVGEALKARLDLLAAKYDCIGYIHGRGLFYGIDLVTDRVSKTPARNAARWIRERLKMLGVMAASTGPFGNIIKLRPPLSFSLYDVDECASALDSALSKLPESELI